MLLVLMLAACKPACDSDTCGSAPPVEPTFDTGPFIMLSWRGEALVEDTSLAGTETQVFELATDTICAFTHTTRDWAHEPTATGERPITAVCEDPDGNTCDFAFAVMLTDGRTDEGDCVDFGVTDGEDGATYGYGFMADYRSEGVPMGATLMYYVSQPEYQRWVGFTPDASYDPATGEFAYEIGPYAVFLSE